MKEFRIIYAICPEEIKMFYQKYISFNIITSAVNNCTVYQFEENIS